MENNLIDRQAAIDALKEALNPSITKFVQAKLAIENLPSAQPELIEKEAYIRGFEQGRTQGMIDAKLQPTRNQLATDCISRQAAIDAINTWDKFGVDERGRLVRWHEGLVLYVRLRDVLTAIVNLPSAQPDHSGDVNGKVDLIDRQAAIDAIETGKKNHGDFLTSSFVGYEMAEKIVKALPPALPDLDEWCTGCKEYDKERNSCPRWNRVIKETLKDLQEERKTQLSEESTTSDYINRCDAIDAVKKNTFRLTFAEEQNCEGHVAWSANAVYSDVIEGKLLELPSAQPEIIRCGECTHKDKKIDYCHYLGITICERDYCSYGERRTDETD